MIGFAPGGATIQWPSVESVSRGWYTLPPGMVTIVPPTLNVAGEWLTTVLSNMAPAGKFGVKRQTERPPACMPVSK